MEENLCLIIINIAHITVCSFTLPIGLNGWDYEETHIRISAGVCIVFSLIGILAGACGIISSAYDLFSL